MNLFVPYRPKKKHIKMDVTSVLMRRYGNRFRIKRWYDSRFTYRNYYDIWDEETQDYVSGTGLILFERVQVSSESIANPRHPDRLKLQSLVDKLNNEQREYISDILKYALRKKKRNV